MENFPGMQYLFLAFVVITLCCFPSCRSYRAGEGEQPGEGHILFVNLSAIRDSLQGGVRLRVIGTVTAGGNLKPPDDVHGGTGMLRCSFLDSSLRPLESLYAADPLAYSVEYMTKDGGFARSEIKRDSANFSLRVQFRTGMRFLRIEKLVSSDSLTEWGIVPLKTIKP